MEKGFSLVPKEEEEENFRNEKSADQTSYLSTEMTKKFSSMAAPMVAVAVSQYLLQVISIVMAGHLDEISLSGVAIATSLTNVTGFSLLVNSSSSFFFDQPNSSSSSFPYPWNIIGMYISGGLRIIYIYIWIKIRFF